MEPSPSNTEPQDCITADAEDRLRLKKDADDPEGRCYDRAMTAVMPAHAQKHRAGHMDAHVGLSAKGIVSDLKVLAAEYEQSTIDSNGCEFATQSGLGGCQGWGDQEGEGC
jgi:hypothetical protein